MSKAVLISIRPKWVAKIASGEKTIEVRKSAPKLETPFKCYIYCTFPQKPFYTLWLNRGTDNRFLADGKVVGEFVCDEILTIDCDSVAPFCKEWDRYVDKETCLTAKELFAYSSNICYGWHISDLKIYDKPKELSEFRKPCDMFLDCINCCRGRLGDLSCKGQIEQPPQSWVYVEELKQ